MLLGGLWHGAAWKFMFWGGAHGMVLAGERFCRDRFFSVLWCRPGVQAGRVLVVFHLVSALWLLFQLGDLHQSWLFLQRLVLWPDGFSPQSIFSCLFFGGSVIFYHLFGWWRNHSQRNNLSPRHEAAVYAVMLFLILTNSGTSGAFIYFQF